MFVSLFKKRVFYSYIKEAIDLRLNDTRLEGHSNKWESREIARLFRNLGFAIDAFDWNRHDFRVDKRYQIVFDIYINLALFLSRAEYTPRTILHLTGSYYRYQNQAEESRLTEFLNKTGVSLKPVRYIRHGDLVDESLAKADFASLVGNEHTLSTYPESVRNKITLVPVTGSVLGLVKDESSYLPEEREYLWFFGSGAVFKGLDLVMDVFGRLPKLKLNVVGNLDGEVDFWKVYRPSLRRKNITYYGFLTPSSDEFKRLARKCYAFIAPSCSEATSTAVVTMLQLGLYPLISKDTGVTLPEGVGIILKDLSAKSIHEAIDRLESMRKKEIIKHIKMIQEMALKKYSRARFSEEVENFLIKATAGV